MHRGASLLSILFWAVRANFIQKKSIQHSVDDRGGMIRFVTQLKMEAIIRQVRARGRHLPARHNTEPILLQHVHRFLVVLTYFPRVGRTRSRIYFSFLFTFVHGHEFRWP